MKNLDLHYLCTNWGNLWGMPIRLFENGVLVLYHSAIDRAIDPFWAYRREIEAITDHVGYFVTPYQSYFGVLNFEGKRIVVGPNRQIAYGNQELHQIAFDLDVPAAQVADFVNAIKYLEPKPLTQVLQALCVYNHFLNEGETLSLTDVAIVASEQKRLVETVSKEEATRAMEGQEDNAFLHNTTNIEEYMLSLVQKGDVAGLNAFFANVPPIRGGQMAPDSLRQAKNLFVVTATLVSRAAIHGGMDPHDALSLSDMYIQKSELCPDLGTITNLNYRLVIDYAERMEKLRYGGEPSPLVLEVNNYIIHHLSEAITVEDMAKALCRGRSRLSTDFKKQSGQNLATYIQGKKIDEGKKLLRYTDKSIVDIALYLGFCSQSHFARIFKQHAGLTPNEYRAKKEGRVGTLPSHVANSPKE